MWRTIKSTTLAIENKKALAQSDKAKHRIWADVFYSKVNAIHDFFDQRDLSRNCEAEPLQTILMK